MPSKHPMEPPRIPRDLYEESLTPTDSPPLTITKEKASVPAEAILGSGFNNFERHSPERQRLILTMLCAAQFFDIVNASGVIVSLPKISEDLGFNPGSIQWVLSAYTLTFASFMLISGRIADIYDPKPAFCAGFIVIGIFSIPIALSTSPIMLIVFRALQGIGAAMNVPTGVAMISITFPDPFEKSRALALYGVLGAIGGVLGIIIGGLLTTYVSWRWVFFLIAILTIPFSVASWFILPSYKTAVRLEWRNIDMPGVLSLTASLSLFVYSISQGNVVGWSTPQIIVTLVFSVVFFATFCMIEYIVERPAFPPNTWLIKNFTPLFFYAWSIYWFSFGTQIQLVDIFTSEWHTSSLSAAVRCAPCGLSSAVAGYLTGIYALRVPRRLLLLSGHIGMGIGAIMFALADTSDKYWTHIIPGVIIGFFGVSVAYAGCTIAVMSNTKPGEDGVVGAMMYTAYQIGATIGLAVITSVTLGVNQKQPLDPLSQHRGYEASFWSVLAMNGIMATITLLFVRN